MSPITRGAQKKPDLIEGIACAPAVTGRVLLDATAHLTWGITGELDDATGVEDAGGVLELVINGVLISLGIQPPIRTPAQKSSPRSASQFLYTVPNLPGTRPTQPCRAMILPAYQVHDTSEFTWAPAASVLVMPHASHQPPAPEPLRNGQDHQRRLADTA